MTDNERREPTQPHGAEPDTGDTNDPLLTIRNLKKHYPIRSGVLNRIQGHVKAVDGVSFAVERGETFAVVGESGCGKTTLGKTIARLYEPTEGEIRFDGQNIESLGERELVPVRRNVQVVYQDPASSLNPRRRIGTIIAEPLVVHDVGTKAERKQRVEELLRRVDLPVGFKHRYPSALSGGQKQRVAIARAVALEPTFVVLDEPTSALDVSVQAKIISLLDELQAELDLTYLIISHDLSLVKNIADRIGVMYLGQFMEVADSERLFETPLNPYTEQLLSAIPTVYEDEERLKPTTVDSEENASEINTVPDPAEPPSGCPFHPRCHKRFEPCDERHPDLIEAEDGHTVRCLLYSADEADREDRPDESRADTSDE